MVTARISRRVCFCSQEILSSIFPPENDPLILDDPLDRDEASGSDQFLGNNDPASIDDKSQLAKIIKKEFGDEEEELEEEEDDFYAPHFEPIIQIQVIVELSLHVYYLNHLIKTIARFIITYSNLM